MLWGALSALSQAKIGEGATYVDRNGGRGNSTCGDRFYVSFGIE